MRILVETSAGSNIGDAFYQISIYQMLKNILKNHEVLMIDVGAARAFKAFKYPYKTKYGFAKNAFDIREQYVGDIYVFSGPILDTNFIPHWGELIKSLNKRGSKYMILSAYGSYDKGVTEKILSFLEKFPPIAFSTRTNKTYEIFSKICENSFNGICNAFFISKTCEIPTIKLNKKFIICSFYSMPEPNIKFDLENNSKIKLNSLVLKHKSNKFWRLTRHFEWLRNQKNNYKEYEIIRTVHDISYNFSHLNFSQPNSFLSYNPINYLSLYKYCSLTISDRIHACVTSLALNNPALLVGKWDRAGLFDRLNLERDGKCFLPPKREYLDHEYEKYILWVKKVIDSNE